MSLFKSAERSLTKLKILIEGPSGSGKTMSALRLAKGIGGKAALVDTEAGSASLYNHILNFDTAVMSPPFQYSKYIAAIRDAEKSDYSVLIIDSISHGWANLLESKNEYDNTKGGNSFTNWGVFTPKHDEFMQTILSANIHIICTARSKQEYVMQQNQSGKMSPIKVGMAAVQRENVSYEFTTVFKINMNHKAEIDKDRTGLFNNNDGTFQITEETGSQLFEWLHKKPDNKSYVNYVKPIEQKEKTNGMG